MMPWSLITQSLGLRLVSKHFPPTPDRLRQGFFFARFLPGVLHYFPMFEACRCFQSDFLANISYSIVTQSY